MFYVAMNYTTAVAMMVSVTVAHAALLGTDLSGTSFLDRMISVEPANIPLAPSDDHTRPEQGRNRGAFSRTGSGTSTTHDDSALISVEQKRMQALADRSKTASASLAIARRDSTITVTDARTRWQPFQTAGATTNDLRDKANPNTTRWGGARLVTERTVSDRPTLVYAYALVTNTNQLVIRAAHRDRQTVGQFELELVDERKS